MNTLLAILMAVTTVLPMGSNPGESKDDFLVRVATFMHGYSWSTGYESCGIIAEKDGAYSVVVGTSESPTYCDSQMIYTGWASTGETIHSHPVTNGVLDGREVLIHTFSEGDYAAGPGYLVDHGKLIYQRGKGTESVVADIPNLAEESVARYVGN